MEIVLLSASALLGTIGLFIVRVCPLLSDRVNERAVRLAKAKRRK